MINTQNVYPGRFGESRDFEVRQVWLRIDDTMECGTSLEVDPGTYIPPLAPIVVPGTMAGGPGHVFDPANDGYSDITGLAREELYCSENVTDPEASMTVVIDGKCRLAFLRYFMATYYPTVDVDEVVAALNGKIRFIDETTV